jgi:hypothetical protein
MRIRLSLWLYTADTIILVDCKLQYKYSAWKSQFFPFAFNIRRIGKRSEQRMWMYVLKLSLGINSMKSSRASSRQSGQKPGNGDSAAL